MTKTFMILALLTFSASALAQDTQNNTQPEPTRIELDQENHRILFFIEGELQAVLEKGRLIVDGDVLSDSYLHGVVDLTTHGAEDASDQ